MRQTSRADPDRPLAAWCEIAIETVCLGRATHRHHKRRRSQGGSDEWSNTLDLCAACHDWVHAHPAYSFGRGWLAPTIYDVTRSKGATP